MKMRIRIKNHNFLLYCYSYCKHNISPNNRNLIFFQNRAALMDHFISKKEN